MKAPKLRGPFRNVRTEPRTFAFKSRHLPETRPEWEERKRRVEEEVNGTSDGPRAIKFKQGGKRAEGRLARRAEAVRAGRMAALACRGCGSLVLVYLTYRAILWVEAQDYDHFSEFHAFQRMTQTIHVPSRPRRQPNRRG